MDLTNILFHFETHNPIGIKECFENGIDPNALFEGKPLIYAMINMYARGPRFKECIKVFVDHGVNFEDEVLLAVLLDDDLTLDNYLSEDKSLLHETYNLDCTFTPLYEASLLHICAEYNHVSAAKILVKHGIDVNIKAGLDNNEFGGHSPIFHTVNQNENRCIDMMKYLLSLDADLNINIKGLIWGHGYEWETFVPDVNPISYAMMGLLRQFQRNEVQIYEVVHLLMKKKYGIEYTSSNIPNKYLLS